MVQQYSNERNMMGQRLDNEIVTVEHTKGLIGKSALAAIIANSLAIDIRPPSNEDFLQAINDSQQTLTRVDWPQERIPKGAKHYAFRQDGTFLCYDDVAERLRHDEVSFKCYARDDKNAIRKWNNFNHEQNAN